MLRHCGAETVPENEAGVRERNMQLRPIVAVGLVVALVFQGLGTAQAQTSTMSDNLVVEEAWAPATDDTASEGYAYFTLRNTGASGARLIEDRAKVADLVAPGETTLEPDGDVRHSAVYSVVVPPHGEVALSPDGNQVLLRDLNGPLIEGTTFELRLTLYDGSQVTVTVPVLAATASGPEATSSQPAGQLG